MSYSPDDADQARKALYEIMRRDASFVSKATQALELGEAYLDVENGHLARIDSDADYWEAIASTGSSDERFTPGSVLDLNTTYCRRVIDRDDSVVLDNAPEQGWADDPAFEEHGLHCFHGTPLVVNDEPYGTVFFASKNPREESFDNDDTLFAELIARVLEFELEHSRQREKLNRRADLITVLSRVLRHNLRNDLTVVRGSLSMLEEDDEIDPELSSRALTAIDDLIDLSDTARALESVIVKDFDRKQVDLMSNIEEVVTDIEFDYPGASITVEGADVVIISAKASLRTAVNELVENAVKHSQNPRVNISVTEKKDSVQLSVRDNGPGLPEQERVVLNEGTETPLVHGSGLGLWLIYWIVTDHDGTIETTVGDHGTDVGITLPRAVDTGSLDQETMERQLRREQDRFEAVFEKAFDAVLLFDDDHRYLDANDRAAELFGLQRDDLLGRSIDEFIPDGLDVREARNEFEGDGYERDTVPIVRSDGAERIVEYTATADVVPGQHLAILRDVTERK